jgi:hypothetical protein
VTAIAGILALATALAGSAQNADAPRLDGLLDESAWAQPHLTAELTQQSPRPGGPTVFITTVRVVVTEQAVFLGFDCRDPEPARIAIHTMQRDSEMDGDDAVALVLDTYGDKKTGYFFQVNAAGARADGLISNPSTFLRLGRHLGCPDRPYPVRLVSENRASGPHAEFRARPLGG